MSRPIRRQISFFVVAFFCTDEMKRMTDVSFAHFAHFAHFFVF